MVDGTYIDSQSLNWIYNAYLCSWCTLVHLLYSSWHSSYGSCYSNRRCSQFPALAVTPVTCNTSYYAELVIILCQATLSSPVLTRATITPHQINGPGGWGGRGRGVIHRDPCPLSLQTIFFFASTMKSRNCWYIITTTFHEIFVLECFHDKISLSFSHFYKKLLVRGQDSSTGFLYKLLSGLKRRARNQSTRTGLGQAAHWYWFQYNNRDPG